MFTLIVEDDPQKAMRVKLVIADADPAGTVEICRSYQSGLRLITTYEGKVDLVILDMTLPTFDPTPETRQGRPRPLGGYDLMRKLRRNGSQTAVVILTALENFGTGFDQITFEELSLRCENEFPAMFKTAIQYSQSNIDWQRKLLNAIGALEC